MERLHLATNDPNFYELGLYGIDIEGAISLFIAKAFSILSTINL